MSLDIDMTLNSELERPCNLPSWLNLTSRSAIGWYKIYNTANVLLVIPRIAPNSTRTVWSRKMSERDSNPRVTTLPELRRRIRRPSHSDLGTAQHSSFPDTLRTISPQHGHVMPGRPVAVVAAAGPNSVLWAGGRQRRWSWSVTGVGGNRNNPPANVVGQLQRPRSRHTAPKADDSTTTKYLYFSTHKHNR